MIKKITIFMITIVLFILIFNTLTLLLVRKGNGYGTDVLNFYKQEKNSIDILFLGSSHSYSSFNPYLIEEKTGLSGYNFCTQQQPIWITYYYLKEALKYQSPKYIVLDVHMAIAQNNDFAEESVNRDAIDKMKFSLNKFNAINKSVETSDERVSYYFNIIKYHSRYKTLSSIDFKTAFCNYTVDNKGYIALPKSNYTFENTPINSSEIQNITNKNEEYLIKIINLAKKENIKLILVKTPAKYSLEEFKKLNYINKLAQEHKITFINYIKDIDSINLNYNSDFYDSGHLNSSGSEKFTNKFIEDSILIK